MGAGDGEGEGEGGAGEGGEVAGGKGGGPKRRGGVGCWRGGGRGREHGGGGRICLGVDEGGRKGVVVEARLDDVGVEGLDEEWVVACQEEVGVEECVCIVRE